MYHEQQLVSCPPAFHQHADIQCTGGHLNENPQLSQPSCHQMHPQQLHQCQLSHQHALSHCVQQQQPRGSWVASDAPTSQAVNFYNSSGHYYNSELSQNSNSLSQQHSYGGSAAQSPIPMVRSAVVTMSQSPTVTTLVSQSPVTIPHNPYVHSVSSNPAVNTKFMCNNVNNMSGSYQASNYNPASRTATPNSICDLPVASNSVHHQTLCTVQCVQQGQHIQCTPLGVHGQQRVEQFEFECRQSVPGTAVVATTALATVVPFPAINGHIPPIINSIIHSDNRRGLSNTPIPEYLPNSPYHSKENSSSREVISSKLSHQHQVIGLPDPTHKQYNNGYF